MKLRLWAVVVLTLLSSLCSAQDISFRHVIGHDLNSTDWRVRYEVQQRNKLALQSKLILPSPSANLPVGTDWATSLGFGTGMVFGQFASTWGYVGGVESPSCTANYAQFAPNATPSSTQANLVLYNQIFRGTSGLCGTGGPNLFQANNVGTTPLGGSAAWSFEGASKGTKFVILEQQKALIHIISVVAGGTLTAPKAPTETTIDFTNITNSHCTAGTVHTATHSDVYVDYATDEAYVGDDAGKLYHISGIFNGTPTMDFCATLNSGAYMGLPIQINISGTDFVWVMSNGRRFYRTQVNSTRTGFTGTTSTIFSSIVGGIADEAPVFDVEGTAVIAYAWANHNIGGTQASLYQINASAATMSAMAELSLGPVVSPSSGTLNGLYLDGYFDNNFWNNGSGGANATGYTCVYPSGSSGAPQLASFQFDSSGVITGYTGMTGNTNINPGSGTTTGNVCTDINESFDSVANVDQLFVSTGNGKNTNANKLSRWNITTPLTSNTATPTASVTNIDGGSTQSVIDYPDSGLGGQTQNIYIGNLATPLATKCGGTAPNFNSCGIKLQQAGLN